MLQHTALAPVLACKTIVLPPPSSIQDGLLALDRNLTIIGCDAAAASLFGYEKSDLIGTHLSRLIPGVAWPEAYAHGPDALAWGTLRFSRVGLEANDAEDGVFSVTASLFQDADGGLLLRVRKLGM